MTGGQHQNMLDVFGEIGIIGHETLPGLRRYLNLPSNVLAIQQLIMDSILRERQSPNLIFVKQVELTH